MPTSDSCVQRRASAVLLLIALAGCSSMSEKECLATDWQAVGYEHGVKGYSGDGLAATRQACAERGVRTDLEAYRAGREQGLREYCRPANGYEVGVHGGRYAGVCPTPLEAGFLRGYDAGRELYVLQARVWSVEAELAEKRADLANAQHGVAGAAIAAVEGRGGNPERVVAVLDATQSAEQVGRLKAEIRELEARRTEYVGELERYRASNPAEI
jgi:hypothetical protein